jgi:hypothetical protein
LITESGTTTSFTQTSSKFQNQAQSQISVTLDGIVTTLSEHHSAYVGLTCERTQFSITKLKHCTGVVSSSAEVHLRIGASNLTSSIFFSKSAEVWFQLTHSAESHLSSVAIVEACQSLLVSSTIVVSF